MAHNPLDPCSKLQALLDRGRQLLGHRFNPFVTHVSDSGIARATVVVSRSIGRSGSGKQTTFQLYSSTQLDTNTGRGKLSGKAGLRNAKKTKHGGTDTTTYQVWFTLEPEFGVPGAVVVRNGDKQEFFLRFVTLERPDGGILCFNCNSWVYPMAKTNSDRLFFSNTSYLPNTTPVALQELRREELTNLRGNGSGRRMEWERVYDYALYNDLGEADSGQHHVRPVLGGSTEYPYPRRGRTGRPLSHTDRMTETRHKFINLDFYVPPDERFSPVKLSEFITNSVHAIVHFVIPEAKSLLEGDVGNFKSFDQMRKDLYSGNRSHVLEGMVMEKLKSFLPEDIFSQVVRAANANPVKFPVPQVIAADEYAWKNDEEFAREMLAGLNPVMIRRMETYPPEWWQRSAILGSHLERNIGGLSVQQAVSMNRIFILDHHGYLLPYLARINAQRGICVYASRTLLFLRNDGTLVPVVIELSLPGSREGEVKNRLFLPASEGTQAALWQLAKAHVAVNDSGYHQLVSHWLHTHAAVEPFIIATRRHLSTMHPVYKLLDPHFKDTMHINALARSILLNSGGVLEKTMFPGKYAMELSSALYKNWQFNEQGLPADLLKRGVAVADSAQPSGVRLLIKDYPYAMDGLDVWAAISSYVSAYCTHCYPTDAAVSSDPELQSWWSEIRNVGHGDTPASSWPRLDSLRSLTQSLTTLIWIASALHASVNFGQYAYAGYLPNRPTRCRRFVPAEGTAEFADFLKDPDGYFLEMLTDRFTATLGLALIEVLSGHTGDEVYLGRRADEQHWTDDVELARIFGEFREELRRVERKINERNADPTLKNRCGPAKVPYMLMYPDVDNVGTGGYKGITGRGIPNSVSI